MRISGASRSTRECCRPRRRSILLAVDVALLLPTDVDRLARHLNAALATEPGALRLDDHHLPHLTLVQQYVVRENIERMFDRIGDAARGRLPLRLRVRGVDAPGPITRAAGAATQLAIEPSPELLGLHERLMDALDVVDQRIGGEGAFYENGEPPRLRDIAWVTAFRTQSAYRRFSPHVTLGHGELHEKVEPFDFDAARLAACHLGRYCTCRVILREWHL